MMRKIKTKIAKVAVCSVTLFALTGCGSKSGSGKGEKDDNGNINPYVSQVQVPADNSVTEDVTNTETTNTETTNTETTSELTAQDGVVYLNTFTEGTNGWTEDDWVQFANDMYARACKTEMEYESCGFIETDPNSSINVNGMDYYECVGYSSIEEITAEYYSLFSRYGRENKFDNLLAEQDGKVYVIPCGRGSDIYYKDSAVLYILEIGDNYIIFNVEDYYYDDLYFGTDEMEQHVNVVNNNFTLVFEEGVWKVGTFTLPY